MSFNVQPAAIDVFAAGMTSLADETTVATEYVDTHLNLVGFADSGIFLNILGSNNEAKGVLRTMISRVEALSAGSGRELTRCADNYRAMDSSAAARIDATYPVPDEDDPLLDETAGTTPPEVGSPKAELVAPSATEPIPDLVSPSAGMLWLIEQVSGVNPAEWAAGEVAGDWAGRADRRQGSARARRLHPVFRDRDPGRGRHDAHALERQRRRGRRALLRRPGRGDRRADTKCCATWVSRTKPSRSACGRWPTRSSASSRRSIDWACMAITAGFSAPVSGPIGLAAAAFGIYKCVNVWDEIIGKLDLALSLSEGFVGGLAGYLGAVRGLDAQPLPAGSYDYPGA